MENTTRKLRVLLVLPYLFSIRDILFTEFCERVEERDDIEITILGDASSRKIIDSKGLKNFTVLDLASLEPMLVGGFNGIWIRWQYRFLDSYLFDSIKLRWGVLNRLNFIKVFSGKSKTEQRKFSAFFDFRNGLRPLFPFPKSRWMYEKLLALRDRWLFRWVDSKHVGVIKNGDYDYALTGRFEFPITVFYWIRVFEEARLPVYSLVGSWDHPTTKGPPSPLFRKFVVASRAMVTQMGEHSGIDSSRIVPIGKIQMDRYAEATSGHALHLMEELGFSNWENYIFFCPNTTGLKEHEVSIAAFLASKVESGEFSQPLLIRCHPQDKNWKRDFFPLDNGNSVRVIQASGFDVAKDDIATAQDDSLVLASLVNRSAVVVQSRGSMALDAIALDKPVISINFDGDLVLEREADSFVYENTYHHYAPLIEAGGVELVSSYDELMDSIRRLTRDPSIGSEGRRKVVEDHLAPLDGKSAQRLLDCLMEFGREVEAES